MSSLPDRSCLSDASVLGPTAWAAWHTDHGEVTVRAIYDDAQSLRVKAHVVKIAWWIEDKHHDGWWHCYPKFPRDWIKGVRPALAGFRSKEMRLLIGYIQLANHRKR